MEKVGLGGMFDTEVAAEIHIVQVDSEHWDRKHLDCMAEAKVEIHNLAAAEEACPLRMVAAVDRNHPR